MRDRPDGATLLALAVEGEALPMDERNHGLIARARAIAERERQVETLIATARAALADCAGAGEVETQLRRLAGMIRAGAYDAPGLEREAVRMVLWRITLAKLRESNPDYLAAAGVD